MKVGDKVEVIGHTKGGGQQFDIGEIVEVIRIGSEKNIKCSNGGNEQWWLDPSEYRPCELPNIHSLHGSYFTAEICFTDVVGRISVNEDGVAYLCQNWYAGGYKNCRDFFGYSYGFCVGDMGYDNLKLCSVQNLKILPSPLEYHKLLTKMMADWEKTFDSNDFVSKIASFLSEIKVFDPKNLGNNQNQSI